MNEKLKNFILQNYGLECNENTKISEIAEDSLTRVEMLFELEKELNLKIPHNEVLDIETVGDLLKFLK